MAGMATIWLPAPGILFRVRHGLVPATNLQRSGAKRGWYSHKLIKMNEMDMDSDMKWFEWWHDNLVRSLSGASSGWVGYNMGWAYQVELWIIWILTHLDTSWHILTRHDATVLRAGNSAFCIPKRLTGGTTFNEIWQRNHLLSPACFGMGNLREGPWKSHGISPKVCRHLPSWHKTCKTNSINIINIINCSSMVLPATCTLSSTGIGSGVQMVFSTYRKLGETPGKVLGI